MLVKDFLKNKPAMRDKKWPAQKALRDAALGKFHAELHHVFDEDRARYSAIRPELITDPAAVEIVA